MTRIKHTEKAADAAPPTSAPAVLTITEVCARWHCDRHTVLDAIHAGRLRAFTVGKRVYRVAIAEIERYERAGEGVPMESSSASAG